MRVAKMQREARPQLNVGQKSGPVRKTGDAIRDQQKRQSQNRDAYQHMDKPARHNAWVGNRKAAHIVVNGGNGAASVKNRAFGRSEEHTSELQSLMRISYAVFCLKKKNL